MRLFVLLLVVSTLFVLPRASAQNARHDAFFKGTVVDAVTGEPIPFVHINVHRPDRSWDSQCDFDGWFFIRCAKSWLFVEVSMTGYETQRFVVDLTSGYVDIPIALKPLAER
jgi:hypothetical protein